jgi:predicted acetyltransferase
VKLDGSVTVRSAAPDESALVARAYERYVDELSQYTDFYSRGEDGSWEPDLLPDWLTLEELHPHLIRTGGEVVGMSFVAAAPFPHMPPDCDHCLSEFWVDPAFRGRGIGAAAARLTFELFPGTWAFEVLNGNTGAVAFWERFFAAYGSDRSALPAVTRAEDVVGFRFYQGAST